MSERTMRGEVAVVGIGETTYYKRGQAPEAEFKLGLQAILNACDDAGVDPRQIDGFASYSNDRNDPPRLAAALGVEELRFSNMQWGGGGGGGAGGRRSTLALLLGGQPLCVPRAAVVGGASGAGGGGAGGAGGAGEVNRPSPGIR